jgi:cell division protein FtsB
MAVYFALPLDLLAKEDYKQMQGVIPLRMHKAFRRAIVLIVLGLIGAYGFVALRGPQGIPALREKWNEIRKLEEENANLQRENDYRRQRVHKLEANPSEQELEIRKKLKLLRPGETSFILPEQPKADSQHAPETPDSK